MRCEILFQFRFSLGALRLKGRTHFRREALKNDLIIDHAGYSVLIAQRATRCVDIIRVHNPDTFLSSRECKQQQTAIIHLPLCNTGSKDGLEDLVTRNGVRVRSRAMSAAFGEWRVLSMSC